jgi:predicted DNA binding CopG/RHH family protein
MFLHHIGANLIPRDGQASRSKKPKGCNLSFSLSVVMKEERTMDGATATEGEAMLQDLPESHDATPADTKSKEKEKRFTLRLSPEAVDTLDWISSRRGNASYQDIIRRALGTEKFLLKLIEEDASIIVEKEGSRPKEIVFR